MAVQLTDEQKQSVRGWVAAGDSLSDIQKKLQSQFGLALTYLDVRFLVIECGVPLKERAPKAAAPPPVPPAGDGLGPDDDAAEDMPAGGPAGPRRVALTVDRVMKPGSLASGSVTFADGVKASWMLDQFGRLALDPGRPGYRPSQQDIAEFQQALREELARKGY